MQRKFKKHVNHGKTNSKDSSIKLNKGKIKKWFMGSKDKEGVIKQLVVYILLISIGFIYIYPLLYMVSKSFMDKSDILDTSIMWIPSTFYTKNYFDAFRAMKFIEALKDSIIVSGIPTIINICICAIVGYGFARFEFPGKKICMGILIVSFIIPPQITMMPNYVLYNDLKILESLKAFIIPSLLGQGLKAQLFILIFYQFFRQIPQALIEAAKIDGCGNFKSFFKIAIPSAAPAILVVFLFSFVWYWNESYLTQLFVSGMSGGGALRTLVVALSSFNESYGATAGTVTGESLGSLNEGIKMAATMLSILPLLIMYFILQRYFIESIDRTGITGE